MMMLYHISFYDDTIIYRYMADAILVMALKIEYHHTTRVVKNLLKNKHFRKFGANLMIREKKFGKFCVGRLRVAPKILGNRSILGSLVPILC